MVLGPLLRPLWTLPQCALIIDLWHATSLWVMKAASGMIGDNVDMIGMRCNLMKRVRGLGQCCRTPCIDWTVDTDSHLALHNAYILHAARQCFAKQCKPKKKAWISDHSMNSFDRSAPPCACGQNFDASGVGARCRECLWCGELCKVAKSPSSNCKCGKREYVPYGASLQTKRRCHVCVLK